jgi:phage terminase Nu1 subunit (DNA packaging protein)
MTKAEVARKAKVSRTTVDTWISKGCPSVRNRRGTHCFEWKAVQAWRACTMPTRVLLSPSYTEARARKETALAGLRELQLRQRQGELVERSAVKMELFAISRPIRDRLENIAPRMAGLIAAESSQEKCFELLRREVRQALEDLCDGTDTDTSRATTTPRSAHA